jgi:hypothetical protein
MRSQVDVKLAKKVALRSRDAFLGMGFLRVIALLFIVFSGLVAICTYFIITQKSVGVSWTALLTADPERPIPSAWVSELSRTFVGDFTDATPRNGVIINGANGPSWNSLVFMFERLKVPIWVYCPSDVPLSKDWRKYLPSAADIAAATRATSQSGIQSDDNPWGVESPWVVHSNDNPWVVHDNPSQSNPSQSSDWGNDDPWGNADPAVDLSNDPGPEGVSNAQSQLDLSCFPLPNKHTGQKQGEDWKAFFARRADSNKKQEARETPSQRNARLSRERSAMNHKIPSRSSKTWVFEWQPQDDYNGFLLRTHITKACVEDIWGNYGKSNRIYNSFSNQWDLCLALDSNCVPDGDFREDIDDLDDPPYPISAIPSPPLSSFSQDIYTYFGNDVSLASRHPGIEGIVPVLHYHFGYRPNGPLSVPLHGSIQFNEWIEKTQWNHLRKLIGDSATEIGSITELQRKRITYFIVFLVNLKESDLGTIPPDLWDLGPQPSLPLAHAQIRVSYAELSEQRFFIVESCQSASLVVWTLAVPDALTAVMCLRRDWGSNSDVRQVALALLKRGMAFKTLQKMAVSPSFRRPLTELRTYSLGHCPSPFQAVYTDYAVYEQLRHEFMNQPRARAAFLHGGLVWRLALHSLGLDHLASVLDGISSEAAAFGLLLCRNGQTYFDDTLSEEEIDFVCGTYYIERRKLSLVQIDCSSANTKLFLAHSIDVVSWWPRPSAWNGSGLNVGFWSARCEDWFQKRLANIRDGVSRTRYASTSDANGPMTATQWKRSLKFNPGTGKMMNNVSAACYDFMTRASGKIN